MTSEPDYDSTRPLLRADATIRYKTDTTFAMPTGGLTDSDSAIYMKGAKASDRLRRKRNT